MRSLMDAEILRAASFRPNISDRRYIDFYRRFSQIFQAVLARLKMRACDYTAELVFEDVLYAPVAGLTHAERAFLSLSLFRTYTAKRQPPVAGLIDELLIESQRHTAACIGEAIRLGIVVTGRTPSLLSEFNLEIKGEELHLLCGPDRWRIVFKISLSFGMKQKIAEGCVR